MSSLTLLGDISGSIVLDAPAVAGSSTITLPTTGGTIRTTTTPGTVLQVVNGFTSTMVTTTTTDVWIDTGIFANITPFFTTSKIMVLVNICGMSKYNSNLYNRMGIRLLRNATVIGIPSLRNMYTATATELSLPGAMYSKLDSPATTSTITYGVQFQVEALSAGNGVSVQRDGNSGESQIFLMEIAA